MKTVFCVELLRSWGGGLRSVQRGLLGFVIALACLPVITRGQDLDSDGIPDAYERGYGRYEVILGPLSWAQAKADAEARGGHLATVINVQEWEDMKAVLGNAMRGRNLWMGGTDEGTEGTWRWITGEKWSFTNWRTGEPNNDSLGNGQGAPENYLIVWSNEPDALDNGKLYWNDVTATGGVLARDGYILERGAWTNPLEKDTDGDGLLDGEEDVGLRSFAIIYGNFSWSEAKLDAESRGGHLATITSAAEWDQVVASVASTSFLLNLWLGASDSEQEGVWKWVTGEPFVYTRWQLGQPVDAGGEDFLYFSTINGSWADRVSNPVTGKTGYLLEIESFAKTDPNNPDTDGDGLKDGEEVKTYKTDPRNIDTDADTLSDFEEVKRWGSNPRSLDSDNDGLTDPSEVFTFKTNPGKADSDGDGFNDKFELDFGSNPNLASEFPGARVNAYTAVEIEFQTKTGWSYQVQYSDDGQVWVNQGSKFPGTGQKVNQLYSTRTTQKRFYRVIIVN